MSTETPDPQTETKEPQQTEVTPEVAPEPAVKPQVRAGGHKIGLALELEQ